MSRPTLLPRRLPSQSAAKTSLPSLPASPGWVALAHPAKWSPAHDGSGRWHVLPDLIRVMLMPGVGGVGRGRDIDGRGTPDARHAIHARQDEGFIEVPQGPVEAWGEVRPDYCLRFRVSSGQWSHAWAWEQPEVMAGNRSVKKVDHDAKVAFLQRVAREVLRLAAPPDDVLEQIRADLRDQARTLAVQAARWPTRATRLDRISERLHSLGWADGLTLPPPPTARVVTPDAAPEAPAAPSYTVEQLEAMLAAMKASSAAPPSPAALVGSPTPAEAALVEPGPRPLRRPTPTTPST
jgi:hypothetical protein